MATIRIENVSFDMLQLSSFAFHYHTADPGHPHFEEAMIRIDFKEGEALIVKGAEAVTLKVQLASLGLKDLSNSWDPLALA